MVQIIVKLIAVLIVLVGAIFIYDSRIITKKFFGFGDQNQATSGMKILGFLMVLLGGIIFYVMCKI